MSKIDRGTSAARSRSPGPTAPASEGAWLGPYTLPGPGLAELRHSGAQLNFVAGYEPGLVHGMATSPTTPTYAHLRQTISSGDQGTGTQEPGLGAGQRPLVADTPTGCRGSTPREGLPPSQTDWLLESILSLL